jgi:hypothetical protein
LTLRVCEHYPTLNAELNRIVLDEDDTAPVLSVRAYLEALPAQAGVHFEDVLRLDRAMFAITTQAVDNIAWYLALLARPTVDDVDWTVAQMALSRHVRLVQQRFDWKSWHKTDQVDLPVACNHPISYVVFRRPRRGPAIARLEGWEHDWLALCGQKPISLGESRANEFRSANAVSNGDLLAFTQHAYRTGMVYRSEFACEQDSVLMLRDDQA